MTSRENLSIDRCNAGKIECLVALRNWSQYGASGLLFFLAHVYYVHYIMKNVNIEINLVIDIQVNYQTHIYLNNYKCCTIVQAMIF